MCDSCQMAVHINCYGITDEELKKEKWFCLPCSKGIFPKNSDGTVNMDRKCVACGHVGGAFSETTNHKWIHTSCAMYLPGMTFTKGGVETPKIPPATPSEKCCLCHSNVGITKRCNFYGCKNYMHIHCVVRRLLFLFYYLLFI